MNDRKFLQHHLAPTSFEPLNLTIAKANGSHLYDENNKPYIDLIGGISVCNVGHNNEHVNEAIIKQIKQFSHVMVYGEVLQAPQIEFSNLLTQHLPPSLNTVYFTNSGSEAVEGAMKLAKRWTGRIEIIACQYSYHGSTQGALSILGDELYKAKYRPLLPAIRQIRHNKLEDIDQITRHTAAVIIEVIQAEGGVLTPEKIWLENLRKKCDETGTLLIFDEIQTGFGRTGKLWAFEHFNVIPDILLLGKALGGGMPMGAFISDRKTMESLASNPILGHMTTFGGHPICCTAGKAAFEYLLNQDLVNQIDVKAELFIKELQHTKIVAIRNKGLMMAVELENFDVVKEIMNKSIARSQNGIFTDWFLFNSKSIRIVPPLIITHQEIIDACNILKEILNEL